MTLRLGEFDLDPDQFELRRDGVPVPVEPLALTLILFICRNPQRLVTRAELVDTIWQGRAVSDWAVASAIKAAPRARRHRRAAPLYPHGARQGLAPYRNGRRRWSRAPGVDRRHPVPQPR